MHRIQQGDHRNLPLKRRPRSERTPTERKLWSHLRGKQLRGGVPPLSRGVLSSFLPLGKGEPEGVEDPFPLTRLSAALVSLFLFFAAPLSAARLSYQGVLEDSSGPFNATATMEFALCSTPNCSIEAGDPLWEGSYAVEVSGGVFSVELGDTQGNEPIEASDIAVEELYLRVKVEGEELIQENYGDPEWPDVSRIQRLVSVPYALGSQGDFIVANGSVGIGTTSPNSLLDVNGTAQLRGSAGGTGLYVDSSGNVGIGTTAPGAKLGVSGDVKFGSGTWALLRPHDQMAIRRAVGKGFVIDTDETAPFDFEIDGGGKVGINSSFNQAEQLYVGGTMRTTGETYLATASGNVGIGTTGPVSKLDVRGDIYLNEGGGGSAGKIRWDDNFSYHWIGYDTTIDPWWMIFNAHKNEGFRFRNPDDGDILIIGGSNNDQTGVGKGIRVNGTSYFNGNVGIGTTNPGAKLEVNGSAIIYHQQSGGLVIQRNTMTKGQSGGGLFLTGGGYPPDPDWGGIFAGTWNDLGTYRTNSDAASGIELKDGQIFFRTASGLPGDGSNFSFPIRLFIDNNGNVGIGTTSPGQKLDVSGNIGLSGDVIFSGATTHRITSPHEVRITPGTGYVFTVDFDQVAPYNLEIDGGGKVGINSGFDQAEQLYVGGTMRTTGATYLATASGNVGIGTPDPQAKLDVRGDLSAESNSWGSCVWKNRVCGTPNNQETIQDFCDNGYYVAGIERWHGDWDYGIECHKLYCCRL